MNDDKEGQFKKYGDEMKDRMMFKARKGDVEHGDNFNTLSNKQLIEEALDEIADLGNFLLRVRDKLIKGE